MSATLRYDIGVAAAEILQNYEGSILTISNTFASPQPQISRSLLEESGAAHLTRWAGIRRGGNTNHVVTLAVKLPSQVELGYLLMHRSYWLARDLRKLPPGNRPLVISTLAKKGLGTLASKLSTSMGIGDPGMIGLPDIFADCDEEAFTGAIHENPGDLANWMAYADWLSERDNQDMITRGKVIAGWLGKKALKMKYGIPIIAQPNKWKWLQEP